MTRSVAVNDSLCFTQEKEDIFNSEIQLFHHFQWQWVFLSLHAGTIAAEYLEGDTRLIQGTVDSVCQHVKNQQTVDKLLQC